MTTSKSSRSVYIDQKAYNCTCVKVHAGVRDTVHCKVNIAYECSCVTLGPSECHSGKVALISIWIIKQQNRTYMHQYEVFWGLISQAPSLWGLPVQREAWYTSQWNTSSSSPLYKLPLCLLLKSIHLLSPMFIHLSNYIHTAVFNSWIYGGCAWMRFVFSICLTEAFFLLTVKMLRAWGRCEKSRVCFCLATEVKDFNLQPSTCTCSVHWSQMTWSNGKKQLRQLSLKGSKKKKKHHRHLLY